jgi:hypothetical protein
MRKITRSLCHDSHCPRRDSKRTSPEVLRSLNVFYNDYDLLLHLGLRKLSPKPNVRKWHSIRHRMCCVWCRCDNTKPRVYWIPRGSVCSERGHGIGAEFCRSGLGVRATRIAERDVSSKSADGRKV